MNSKSGILVGTFAALGLLGSTMTLAADTAPAAPAKVSTSNKWRVEFDGKSDVEGDIVFAIILPDSTTNVTTHVKKGTSENSWPRKSSRH